MTLPYAEPYKIKMTEAIRTSTRAERETWIREASYNLFKLRSDQVTIDLLTDSGTGSMSDRQWAAMMTGDESYAGASSYFRLRETISRLFGMPFFLPTHQGRAAENVIFSALLKEGDIVPGNSHFDTTKGHIEFRRCHAVDCTIDDAADTQKELPFKGEMDIAKLEKLLRENPREKVPCVVLTITNNTAGGQPVSMRNIRETAEVCRRYGVPLLLDSARFAENAYFIKTREAGYADKTIKEIVREIYTYADIMTISAKKDGVVNMGGFVAMRSEELYKRAMTFSIMFEGYVTYGGMSGRDMDALAVGLDENTEFEQLDARIRQVKLLGDLLDEYGVPYQRPAGGHAIFVDAKKVLPNLPKEQFIAQTLAVELYLEAGIRGVELGSILADRDPDTHENRYPRLELLRLAIPRRVYSDNHIRVIAAACRKASVHAFIAALPQGYDTQVGELGDTLSGGERQRIALARAILKDAPIVVLDEATASVDPENEQALLSAIQELTKDKTLISIAHRLSTVRNADQIIVIDQGRIVQRGTHHELLQKEGIYQRFLTLRTAATGWQL